MNKDIDNRSALVYIVRRHITYIIKKSVNLRLSQANLFVLLNSKLFFEFRFFCFPFVDSFRQHFDRLSLFNAPPKIFDCGVYFFDRLF